MTIELISRASGHADRIAITDGDQRLSYLDLLDRSARFACHLLGEKQDLEEERIALVLLASADYAVAQWGIWRAGGIAVPLNTGASEDDLEYALTVTGVRKLITSSATQSISQLCDRLGIACLDVSELTVALGAEHDLPKIDSARRAMIVFTSGTTSRPKGVVSTHKTIQSQITTLIKAWAWQAEDRIPLFLPMHHVHGIVNVLSCALWAGAEVETFPAFDAHVICDRVAKNAYSLFMAVPTIYVKLIEFLGGQMPSKRDEVCSGFRTMRLMVSGSAALPVKVHEDWQALTGQVLLERYGMTEIGMALSNPLHGERRPGAVGLPLPGVSITLVDEAGSVVKGENAPGEIWVQGDNVFQSYWDNPEATEASFSDGWFRTGDMAVREEGYYRIMGRLSMDIIKSGGEKLSALEIEGALLTHPDIQECAVVGVPDETWGEAVCAAIVLRSGADLEYASLKDWARTRMTAYKIPKQICLVESLPRNAMGKVTKQKVKSLF